MNIAVTHPAPGLPPRRAFNVEDIRRMVEVGVLHEGENIELVEGEIVVMAAKGYAHEMVRKALIKAVNPARADADIGLEMTIQFATDILLEPDIAVFPSGRLRRSDAGFVTIEKGDCSLIIEVSVSSLGYDKGRKAALYARLGVCELWVIDAQERRAFVHTGPSDDGWLSIVEHGADDALTTPALPGFSFRLGDISL